MTKDDLILALLPLALDSDIVKGSAVMAQYGETDASGVHPLTNIYGEVANALADCDVVAQVILHQKERMVDESVDVKAIYEAVSARRKIG